MMQLGVNMRGSRDAPWARSAMRVLAVLALCVAPSTSFVVAPRPRAPPPRLALPGAVEFALRGKALPPEAVAALVYAAPLPPLRATLRRLRGKASSIAAAPPRGRFAAAYVLALLAYALRDAAPASKAACLFAGLRLATRPPYGADARTAPARPSRAAHAAAAVALGAGKESDIPNFKGSHLGRFPLVSADFWTSDHLSERSRSVDALSGTRARGTLMLKRT